MRSINIRNMGSWHGNHLALLRARSSRTKRDNYFMRFQPAYKKFQARNTMCLRTYQLILRQAKIQINEPISLKRTGSALKPAVRLTSAASLLTERTPLLWSGKECNGPYADESMRFTCLWVGTRVHISNRIAVYLMLPEKMMMHPTTTRIVE